MKSKLIMLITIAIICILLTSVMFVQFKTVRVVERSGISDMRESKTVEFKREYTENLKYEILAFANTSGGTVYIGVDDDGTAVGISDIDKTMLSITNMIRDSIRPDITLFTDVHVTKMDGMEIIAVDVQRGTDRPYYIHGKE